MTCFFFYFGLPLFLTNILLVFPLIDTTLHISNLVRELYGREKLRGSNLTLITLLDQGLRRSQQIIVFISSFVVYSVVFCILKVGGITVVRGVFV